ncbi:DUF1000-domain-containing protein [Gymnopus androsaceus JB14]|uniref:DUF1000-domain-containing protein n=1 Tax=Gymnopus androsaceus JB14 TaxID=1447944 RepID=A0A6A4I454_9AGAR|nr:DUF1000-domain-containing protein [Gymnopus androsaceus JB14]
MPHIHDQNCGHEHDHDDHESNTGAQDNLYNQIDISNVVLLNANEDCGVGDVIKPWHARMSEDKFVESDADDQLIIRIPFTGSVKLRSILLKDWSWRSYALRKSRCFANADNLDFQDVSDKTPTQEFDIPQGREVGEYAVKPAKFPNVSSLTLFFPASQGAETVRIYYIGLLGTWTERKSNPVITVYEAQANLADHQKIQGTEGNFSTPQR